MVPPGNAPPLTRVHCDPFGFVAFQALNSFEKSASVPSIDVALMNAVEVQFLKFIPPPVQVGAVATNCALSVSLMGIAAASWSRNNGMAALRSARRTPRLILFDGKMLSVAVSGLRAQAQRQSVL